jgi:hypothetical protein
MIVSDEMLIPFEYRGNKYLITYNDLVRFNGYLFDIHESTELSDKDFLENWLKIVDKG